MKKRMLLIALAACNGGGGKQSETAAADSTQPIPSSPHRTTFGIQFNPATLRPGDTVGELMVNSVSAQQTPIDSTYVGIARFRNEITLGGHTIRHFEPDLSKTTVCFEADSASATRLPRWLGDERRAWFCFENQPEAARSLGPASDGLRATVVIDDFTIHRGLSDQVNSARFVRLIARGIGASR